MLKNGKDHRRVRHPQQVYFERLLQALEPETRWLDVGCGRRLAPDWLTGQAELESELLARAKYLAGVDPDFAALLDNRLCHLRVQADVAQLPFSNGSFDLATSNMVFEHVERPRPSLVEIRRVLRRGGRLILLTPNWLDVVTIAASLTPNRFHPMIVSRLESRRAADVYPTYFRFNRPQTVEKLLRETGFKDWKIQQVEHPDAYSHAPIVSIIESAWHRLARRWPALRGTLLIEAEA